MELPGRWLRAGALARVRRSTPPAGALELKTMADGSGTDLALLGAPDGPDRGGVWLDEP